MKKLIYIASFIVLVICSCTEVIDINLNDDKHSRLVVEGKITTETKAHRIRLTRSSDYFSNKPSPREIGASVTISDSENEFILHESTSEPGIYETDPGFFGRVGQTYKLNIVTSDGKEYSSSAYLDTVFNMDSVLYEYTEDFFRVMQWGFYESKGIYILSLYAQEPEGIGNCYQFDIYLQNEYGEYIKDNDTLNEAVYQNDELIDGLYIMGAEFYALDREIFNKDTIQIYDPDNGGNIDALRISKNIRIEMLSIPQEQIDYNIAVLYETEFQGGMFSGPPSNIPSNISNGALGFFTASDITSLDIQIVDTVLFE